MKLTYIAFSFCLAALIAACGPSVATPIEPTPDIAAIRTSAARTVIAQFTLTAAAFTPTPPPIEETPAPSETATATVPPVAQITDTAGTSIALCDYLDFDPLTIDVNVPDGTIMSPGQDFIKTWRVKNAGICPWGAGYVLTYAGYSDRMSGQFIALTEVVQPGQEVELSVQFKAPSQPGEYLSAWQMRNPAGVTFPKIIFVKIIVQ
ncbi:MAG TPA: NBR1-Ig-like domain-containing protein [Anaerolineales bacterium]|nr:NBR1-Ig-like domain-containing protein [Anaerolineales bacterium]